MHWDALGCIGYFLTWETLQGPYSSYLKLTRWICFWNCSVAGPLESPRPNVLRFGRGPLWNHHWCQCEVSVPSWAVTCAYGICMDIGCSDKPINLQLYKWNMTWNLCTLWLFDIARDKCPFTDDVPFETSIYQRFSIAMLHTQMVHQSIVDRQQRFAEDQLDKAQISVCLWPDDLSSVRSTLVI